MDNPIEYITSRLLLYFVEKIDDADEVPKVPPYGVEVFKFNTEKLAQNGEISLMTNVKFWAYFCKKNKMQMRQQGINLLYNEGRPVPSEAEKENFLKFARTWLLPVRALEPHISGRCSVFFQRDIVKESIIRLVLNGSSETLPYGHLQKNPRKLVRLNSLQLGYINREESLTDCRAKLLASILRRVLEQSSWTLLSENNKEATLDSDSEQSDRSENSPVTSDDSAVTQEQANNIRDRQRQRNPVLVLNVRSYNFRSGDMLNRTNRDTLIIVGPVIEPTCKRISTISASAYEAIRANHMQLVALHKYGIRPHKIDSPMEVGKRLGEAAVIVDLFEVRQRGAVVLIRNGVGCSRGASFILYNSSRVETLLRTFDELVRENKLAPLPSLSEIDLSLLKEDDEWDLIFTFLLRYPNLIESCTEQLANGEFLIHLLVRFLNNFVAAFSGYYRRTRILITRPNCVAIVHARIYLIKAIQVVLNNALSLLGIEPMPAM